MNNLQSDHTDRHPSALRRTGLLPCARVGESQKLKPTTAATNKQNPRQKNKNIKLTTENKKTQTSTHRVRPCLWQCGKEKNLWGEDERV